jgi:hypothetical protein
VTCYHLPHPRVPHEQCVSAPFVSIIAPSRFPPEINLRGKKNFKKNLKKKESGNSLLMRFMHLRMINSASKCLKITLKVIKFSKPEIKLKKKSS